MTYKRISGLRGNPIELDVSFRRGGVLTDPYAIKTVEIYKTQVLAHNKVAEFVLDSPCSDAYPAPIERVTADIPAGNCGTDAIEGQAIPGKYKLIWDVPSDAVVPDVYFDVWTYYPTNPCLLPEFEGSTECELGTDGTYCHTDLDSDDLSGLRLSCCNRFWLYPDQWLCTDSLQTVRLGFEPLDQKFNQPEIRPLEIGIMPLPLYDYNYNLVAPMLPFLTGTIRIETMNREVLVNDAPLDIGIRQGSYRTNPYVFKYLLDTSNFLIGTYKYRVTAILPDGSSRTSKNFILTIA